MNELLVQRHDRVLAPNGRMYAIRRVNKSGKCMVRCCGKDVIGSVTRDVLSDGQKIFTPEGRNARLLLTVGKVVAVEPEGRVIVNVGPAEQLV